jgi:hypothetical protein
VEVVQRLGFGKRGIAQTALHVVQGKRDPSGYGIV